MRYDDSRSRLKRLLADRGLPNQPQDTVSSSALETEAERNTVYCTDNELQVVEKVEHLSLCAEVYQITFDPDVPVESYNPAPDAILTEGHKFPKSRSSYW